MLDFERGRALDPQNQRGGFALIFVAELPDKTMFASLILASRVTGEAFSANATLVDNDYGLALAR